MNHWLVVGVSLEKPMDLQAKCTPMHRPLEQGWCLGTEFYYGFLCKMTEVLQIGESSGNLVTFSSFFVSDDKILS